MIIWSTASTQFTYVHFEFNPEFHEAAVSVKQVHIQVQYKHDEISP